MTTQLPLLLDTPEMVVVALKQLENSNSKVERAKATQEALDTSLATAKSTLQEYETAHKEVERNFILASCLSLEEELKKNGKGWCPICERVVTFTGFACAYTTTPMHRPASDGDHGYMGGSPEYNWTKYVYSRVPDITSHKKCDRMFEDRGGSLLDHSFGGTIIDAPAELFAQYGIPGLDPEMVKRCKLTVWDFAPEAPKAQRQ